MSKTKVGFDLGCSNLKVVTVHDNTVHTDVVRIPEGVLDTEGFVKEPDVFVQFLKGVKKDLRLPRNGGAFVLPSGHSSCKLAVLPDMIESQVMINLPHEFTDFMDEPSSSYKFDYAMCKSDPASGENPDDGRLAMMVACSKKAYLAGYFDLFKRAGIKLTRMVPQEMAAVRVCSSVGDGEYCIIDLGYRGVRAYMCWNGRIRASRQISSGCNVLEVTLADSESVANYLAGTWFRDNESDCQSEAVLTRVYNEVAVEILKTVNFYQFTYKSSLDGIYLIGGGALVNAFRDVIKSTTGLAVLDISDLIKGSDTDAVMGFMARGAMLVGG